jgi:high-mobility group nucleosome-binding domain-containing protein 2
MADLPDTPATGGTRRSRRVSKPAKPGVDPSPGKVNRELAAEDNPQLWGDIDSTSAAAGADTPNDERLKRDKPPHWG